MISQILIIVNKETSECIDKVVTALTVATISVTNCNDYVLNYQYDIHIFIYIYNFI